jgi:hypothetical protein
MLNGQTVTHSIFCLISGLVAVRCIILLVLKGGLNFFVRPSIVLRMRICMMSIGLFLWTQLLMRWLDIVKNHRRPGSLERSWIVKFAGKQRGGMRWLFSIIFIFSISLLWPRRSRGKIAIGSWGFSITPNFCTDVYSPPKRFNA